ncbi:MAG: secondary thiamine-phosphate synthase enzyme YjbQ [Pseudomonadota bacterium]|nr:secondary thiamine-phosphate synthase enzyme YjbQ [Pseudomonadota bacterium]
MYREEFTYFTNGQGLYEITKDVEKAVSSSTLSSGICNLFIQHTSASLIIQENASMDVQKDILNFFNKLAPEGSEYNHNTEGPDDMPAHLKSLLSDTSLSIPVKDNKLDLGTWQGVFLFEHRDGNFQRKVVTTIFD